jgi:hypothetical protein
MGVLGKLPRRSVFFLAAAALLGCGSQTPPPSAQAPESAAAEPQAATAGIYGDPSAPVAGRVLGTVIHTQDAEEFSYVVLKTLLDRYTESKGITVTQAEKEAYVASVKAALAADPAVAPAMGEESAEDHAARLEIADAFIRQWKVSRALHQRYGGRIIFQQGGPELLDAYRAFLEERQAAGDFSIEDESIATAFWRYYKDDSIHSFYAPGSEEEAMAFAVEPWSSESQATAPVTGSRND